MLYESCEEVSAEFWLELAQLSPAEVSRRTCAAFSQGAWRLPFLNRLLAVDPQNRTLQIEGAGAETREPDFRLCLTALLYLSRVNPAALGPLVSPVELTGGATFFMERGPHALPHEPLEIHFGRDRPDFLRAGEVLGAEPRAAGDAALAFEIFPGLTVEVILWLADEEFPAQVSFRVPASLERVWHLDAVLALLQLLTRELLAAVA
ncbi:MAG: DUF3786 domain-containing protein [Desulfobaccales bacterium]